MKSQITAFFPHLLPLGLPTHDGIYLPFLESRRGTVQRMAMAIMTKFGARKLPLMSCILLIVGCNGQPKADQMNWQTVCDKWSEQGYDSLAEPEQVWLNTRGFIDAVNDGGLISFFYNNWANHYDDTAFALGELEAFEALEILESFGAFFGDEVPDDISERNAIINSWDDNGPEIKASDQVDPVLMPLFVPLQKKLDAYLLEHGLDPS